VGWAHGVVKSATWPRLSNRYSQEDGRRRSAAFDGTIPTLFGLLCGALLFAPQPKRAIMPRDRASTRAGLFLAAPAAIFSTSLTTGRRRGVLARGRRDSHSAEKRPCPGHVVAYLPGPAPTRSAGSCPRGGQAEMLQLRRFSGSAAPVVRGNKSQ
jgi:hypothetical protein